MTTTLVVGGVLIGTAIVLWLACEWRVNDRRRARRARCELLKPHLTGEIDL